MLGDLQRDPNLENYPLLLGCSAVSGDCWQGSSNPKP